MSTMLERRMAARLPREALARARTLFIWEGSLATGFLTCTGGTILTGFALWLGATPFHIGLLTSLPAFAALAQLLAPYFTERQGQRKRLMTLMAGGQRVLWLVVAALPFVVLPPGIGIALLIALVTGSAMLGAIGAVPWLSWMADLVPKDVRGRYFATRNLIMGTVGLILGPVVGVFLDLWHGWAGVASPFGFTSPSPPERWWDCWQCGFCGILWNRPWSAAPVSHRSTSSCCRGRTPTSAV